MFPYPWLMLKAFLPCLLALVFSAAALHAEEDVVRIGVLTDLSGSMADAAGQGSVSAAQMAMEDASRFFQRPIAVISADYQSRGDLAQHISEDWINRQNVDMVVDVPNPIIASHLQDLFQAKKKILVSSMPRRSDDESTCGMNGIFWLYDRETLTNNLVRALIAERKQRWFILGNDSPQGMNRAAVVKNSLQQYGGEVVGEAYFGPRMSGITTILDQVKPTQADVLYLAMERPDILHILRRWPAEPPANSPTLAFGTLPFSDMYDLQERNLPPFYVASSFYWNQNDAARAFSNRFAERNHGLMPTAIHASVYSAVTHYLHGVAATDSKDASAVLAHMKANPLQDNFFSGARIRADGTVLHKIHLLLSKPPSEREGTSDFFKIVKVLSGPDLVTPSEPNCPKPEALPTN
jgi:branched-chain amino acid transport system substrate-binding protein